MKKAILLLVLLFFTQTNYAQNRHNDKYADYLYALNSMSGLFSRLIDNEDAIAHSPERLNVMNLAVNFNRKVGVLLINNNRLLTLINRGGFKDKGFANAYRIVEKNVTDLKKILTDNRKLIDDLNMSNFRSAEIYDRLDISLYENDELLREAATNRGRKKFKIKVTDNIMKSVVILNECHGKVAALYSKLK